MYNHRTFSGDVGGLICQGFLSKGDKTYISGIMVLRCSFISIIIKIICITNGFISRFSKYITKIVN